MEIPKIEQNIEKIYIPFYIIAFELVASNSHYYEENTCHQKSRFKQRILRVKISLKVTFSRSFLLTEIKKYNKNAVMQISEVFETL